MFGPELYLLGFILAGVTLYAILGGADFGAGIWEINLAFQTEEQEQKLINKAMGPVWEANHVWLIFVIVVMFTAFPKAFAVLCQSLWTPMFIAVGAIAVRGIGFVFRAYSNSNTLFWTVLFAISSAVAPFFLGLMVGAVASSRLFDGPLTASNSLPWLSALSIFSGFYAVALCCYLSSVFLVREAKQRQLPEIMERWRSRSLAMGAWMGVLSTAGIGILFSEHPELWTQFSLRASGLVIVSMIAGSGSLAALFYRRTLFASLLAALAVTTVIWGLALAQFPYLVPPTIDINTAKAPRATLVACLAICCAGSVILLPSLAFLFHLFKVNAKREENEENVVTA